LTVLEPLFALLSTCRRLLLPGIFVLPAMLLVRLLSSRMLEPPSVSPELECRVLRLNGNLPSPFGLRLPSASQEVEILLCLIGLSDLRGEMDLVGVRTSLGLSFGASFALGDTLRLSECCLLTPFGFELALEAAEAAEAAPADVLADVMDDSELRLCFTGTCLGDDFKSVAVKLARVSSRSCVRRLETFGAKTSGLSNSGSPIAADRRPRGGEDAADSEVSEAPRTS